jgi:hypothetical protein
MLSVTIKAYYAECRYAECRGTLKNLELYSQNFIFFQAYEWAK